MSNYEDFELFTNSNSLSFASSEGNSKNLENKLNDDLNGWVLVKVPIKREFVD